MLERIILTKILASYMDVVSLEFARWINTEQRKINGHFINLKKFYTKHKNKNEKKKLTETARERERARAEVREKTNKIKIYEKKRKKSSQ